MSAPLFLPREKAAPVADKATGFRRGPEALALLLFTIAAYLLLALASLECSPVDPELRGLMDLGSGRPGRSLHTERSLLQQKVTRQPLGRAPLERRTLRRTSPRE